MLQADPDPRDPEGRDTAPAARRRSGVPQAERPSPGCHPPWHPSSPALPRKSFYLRNALSTPRLDAPGIADPPCAGSGEVHVRIARPHPNRLDDRARNPLALAPVVCALVSPQRGRTQRQLSVRMTPCYPATDSSSSGSLSAASGLEASGTNRTSTRIPRAAATL